MAKKPSTLPAQELVVVSAIRDGALVLRDGSLRKVLMVSSINFELKSEQEQNAIAFSFQGLLNSLDFSLEFLIHSRRLNIEPYLATLRERERLEESELIKTQMSEHIEFIRGLVGLANIMRKTFYVVIPYVGVKAAVKGVALGLRGVLKGGVSKGALLSEEEFQQGVTQLQQRVDHVSLELSRMGLRSILLGDEELKELLLNFYNPTKVEHILKHE